MNLLANVVRRLRRIGGRVIGSLADRDAFHICVFLEPGLTQQANRSARRVEQTDREKGTLSTALPAGFPLEQVSLVPTISQPLTEEHMRHQGFDIATYDWGWTVNGEEADELLGDYLFDECSG